MIIVRNYNRFLVRTKNSSIPRWRDFGIHRFSSDLKQLCIFSSVEEARRLIDSQPELEEEYDAWIVGSDPATWSD